MRIDVAKDVAGVVRIVVVVEVVVVVDVVAVAVCEQTGSSPHGDVGLRCRCLWALQVGHRTGAILVLRSLQLPGFRRRGCHRYETKLARRSLRLLATGVGVGGYWGWRWRSLRLALAGS